MTCFGGLYKKKKARPLIDKKRTFAAAALRHAQALEAVSAFFHRRLLCWSSLVPCTLDRCGRLAAGGSGRLASPLRARARRSTMSVAVSVIVPVTLTVAVASTWRRRVFGLDALCAGAAGGSGQPALLEPDVEQRRHGLQLLVANEAEQAADVDKVDEARVELLVGTQVPELEPVAVVDVGVAAQHLAVDVADVAAEVGWEVAGLAEPVCIAVCSNRSGGAGSKRWWDAAEGLGGKEGWVCHFACDPLLYVADVLVSGDADGFFGIVEPGVGCAGGK